MRRTFWKLSALAFAFLIAGCAQDSPKSSPVSESKPAAEARVSPPQTNQIRVSAEDLPPGAYQVLGKLEVSKPWYGNLDESKKMLADRARKLGADAVIQAKVWHSPSGFAWAAPHGSGVAIKLTNPASMNLEALPGGWF